MLSSVMWFAPNILVTVVPPAANRRTASGSLVITVSGTVSPQRAAVASWTGLYAAATRAGWFTHSTGSDDSTPPSPNLASMNAWCRSAPFSSAGNRNAVGLRYQTDRISSSSTTRPGVRSRPAQRPSRNRASTLNRDGNHAVSIRHTGTPRPLQLEDHLVGAGVELVGEDQDGHTGCGLSGTKSYVQSSERPSSP